MANTITTIFSLNGSRNFLARIEITGDGSGDETGTVVLDPANMTGVPTTFKIKSINANLDGFSGSLKWDATAPTLALALPTYDTEMDFFESGAPLTNDAGAGITGKLTLTTQGLTATGTGTIVINGYH